MPTTLTADSRAETKRLWGRRGAREVTDEEAREIEENVSGFFTLLMTWAAAATSKRDNTDNGGASS